MAWAKPIAEPCPSCGGAYLVEKYLKSGAWAQCPNKECKFKRELEVNGEKYTLTVSPEGFRLVVKGKRKGIELTWASILGGDAALASALNAATAVARHDTTHTRH